MKSRARRNAAFIGAVLSTVVAFAGALGMKDRVRLVDIVTLFAGGIGAGASLTAAVAARRRARPNIFPALKYADGPAARAWLERVFGFTTLSQMDRADGGIAHAELRLGPGILMLGSIGAPDPANPWPTALHALYVYVEDIDAHYQRARSAGAKIVRELHDTSYGAREYSATDVEGRLWSFGTYYPET